MKIGDEATATLWVDDKPIAFEGTVHAFSSDGQRVQIRIDNGILVWVDAKDVRPSD